VTEELLGEHHPLRPHWSCRTCGLPWPCEPARVRLRAEVDGDPVVAVHVFGLWLHASQDLAGVPAADLRARFLGWLGGEPADEPGP
jgi:hypothetical protein